MYTKPDKDDRGFLMLCECKKSLWFHQLDMDGNHYPFSDQFSLCFLSAWMLECKFKLSLLSYFAGGNNPQTYKHSMPTTSVLRHTVERLYAYTKSSRPTTNRQLVTLVKIVNTGAERKQLPPLQWSALLSPLMRCAGENGWYQWFDTCSIEKLTLKEWALPFHSLLHVCELILRFTHFEKLKVSLFEWTWMTKCGWDNKFCKMSLSWADLLR